MPCPLQLGLPQSCCCGFLPSEAHPNLAKTTSPTSLRRHMHLVKSAPLPRCTSWSSRGQRHCPQWLSVPCEEGMAPTACDTKTSLSILPELPWLASSLHRGYTIPVEEDPKEQLAAAPCPHLHALYEAMQAGLVLEAAESSL